MGCLFSFERAEELAGLSKVFGACAVRIAGRDGIPPEGSTEIRLHGPLRDGRNISTERAMVSFRTPTGAPVALLEQLWADDENTHIVGRTAIAVNPCTGQIYDMDLFHQSCAGDFTSIIARGEISLDRIRKKTNREKRGGAHKHGAHVLARLMHRAEKARQTVVRFQEAAELLGVKADPAILKSNRQLFRIDKASQIGDCSPVLPCS